MKIIFNSLAIMAILLTTQETYSLKLYKAEAPVAAKKEDE